MTHYLQETLGVESEFGLFIPILKKGSLIPCEKVRLMFSPEIDNQKEIVVKVRSGNSWDSRNNKLLGEVVFPDLLPCYRGVPFISISFFINDNNKLHVLVENTKSGAIKHILSEVAITDETKNIKNFDFALSNESHIEKSKIYSLAKRMIISCQKTLSLTHEIMTSEKDEVENIINSLEAALKADSNANTISELMDKLSSSAINMHYAIFTNK